MLNSSFVSLDAVRQEQLDFWDNVAPRMPGVIIAKQIAPHPGTGYSGEAITTMWSPIPIINRKKVEAM